MQDTILIMGLSKAKAHPMNVLWGSYRRGIWGIYTLENPLDIVSYGWVKYASPIDSGIVDISSTRPLLMNVWMRGILGSTEITLPLAQADLDLNIDEGYGASQIMAEVNHMCNVTLAKMAVFRIEDLTKMLKGK